MTKRFKKCFPIDFYGEDKTWRFAIRARNANEVFDALMWRSYLSVRRDEFNLLHLAVKLFSYECNQSESSIAQYSSVYGCSLRVKMMGPVVEVATLNKIQREKNIKDHTQFSMDYNLHNLNEEVIQ